MKQSRHNLSVPVMLRTALHCYQTGQVQSAEQHCLKICAVEPQQPDALHLLAVIYAQTRRYPLANEYFLKAISSDSNRADFYSNYANALWEQDRIEEAVDYCQQSLQLDPENADTYNILGNILLSQYRTKEAAASFRKALALRPGYPHALNNLGNTLQKMNKTEEAIACYRQALALQENYPEAHNNLGQGFKQLGRIDEARKHFLRAIALRPDFYSAKQHCAEVDPAWLEPLQGKRVTLRRYQQDDAAYLHRCYLDAAFMGLYNHYIPRHQHIDDLAAKLGQANKKHPCQLKTVDWIIFKKSIEKPAGIANLVDIQFSHRRAEFQIGLPDPSDRASGIGLEATLLVLDYAFNRVGLNKLTTVVYGHNLSSQKNTLALGFVQESLLREQLIDTRSGKFIDLFGNGMLLRDFRLNNRLSRLSKRLLGRDITLSCS
ncbi:GNAT family N-acetyltransferase [Nitrosomonas sp.]|uniref:GNAT family N-acetyltransferase n=1 Tax=Nitrosomonas sp. TaxID=42353 RepID=UPI00207DA7CB|nr:GNAT family N-acetyltransferase [Nitrosomonas sp.]GJL74930.1 MAG: hypothetical protein NMNS02_10360 [Nitrosomonas sp.]